MESAGSLRYVDRASARRLGVSWRLVDRRALLAVGLVTLVLAPAAAVGATSPAASSHHHVIDEVDSGDVPAGEPTEFVLQVDEPALVDLDTAEIDHELDAVDGQYIVEFATELGRQRTLPEVEAAGWTVLHRSQEHGVGAGLGSDRPWALLEIEPAADTDVDALVGELRARPDVLRVNPNHVRRLVQVDPPWGLDRVDQRSLPLSGSYQVGSTGTGVRVYVIDDGIRREHVDFGNRVTAGAHLQIFDTDSDPDCSTHGSHVAGTIGGTFAGVAKQVELIPIRVFNCNGSASDFAILAAMDWIIADHAKRGGGTAVVNMSFGGEPSNSMDAKVADLDAAGIVAVAAIGNQGKELCGSPARAAASLGVASSTSGDARSGFSNFGACVDLYAPGSAILSVDSRFGQTQEFGLMSGTSMATPHVAGAAALLIERHPDWTPAQIRARLIADATTGAIANPGANTPNRLLWVDPAAPSSAPSPPPSSPSPAPAPSPAPKEPHPPPPPPPVGFVSRDPDRLVDSRIGLGVIGPLGANQTVVVPVVGRAGVPQDATAVALNVTAVDPVEGGFVSVTPCNGAGVPTTSNLNVEAGVTVANAVITPIGADGSICVYTSGATQLLVDVVGSFSAGFGSVQPERLLDTRSTGAVGAGSITRVRVAGRAGTSVTARTAIVNVTAVDPSEPGYLTVYPCTASVPTASNVNFGPGQVVPNAVVARTSAEGDVCIYSSAVTHLLLDVTGTLGDGFVSLSPERFLETRSGPAPGAGSITRVEIAGSRGVPGDATAVVLNVTVVDPVEAGFVSVFPCGPDWASYQPRTSSLNFVAGRNVANAVVSPLGTAGGTSAGAVCVYTSATAHLLVDVAGAFR